MNPTEIRAIQNEALALQAKALQQIAELQSLAAAAVLLLHAAESYHHGHLVAASHVCQMVCRPRDQLQPLAESLGFSLDPSPTYVGQFILNIK